VPPVELAIDLEEVVKNLLTLGLDEAYVRNQFAGLADEAWLGEVAALLIESEAALVLPNDMAFPQALFELTETLRQAGAKACSGETTAGALALTFLGPQPRSFVVQAAPDASVLALVRAVATVIPRAQQVLLALEAERRDAVTLVVLERGTFVALRAALGDDALERVFERAAAPTQDVQLLPYNEPLRAIDLSARYEAKRAELAAEPADENGVVERIRAYDPRIAWPVACKRPPGDDFLEFCSGLAGGSLARCIARDGDRALANLLYHYALASCVGAHYDVAAARLNPGRSAQGVLGLGQLTWSWFIFEALGATEEAAISGKLLDHDWVRTQERVSVSQRQRAYYDLGAYLRSGVTGPALGRLFPLVALAERAGWEDRAMLDAALATHSETLGDQYTESPLYYLWPAPLYALARKADAQDLLPGNRFCARPLSIAAVDLRDETVLRLKEQLLRFSLLDEARFSPLLDPLPVVVDVWVTEVDGQNAHGRTMLAARDDAEHRVVAPHAGLGMRPGEVWLFEVQGSEVSQVEASFDDLGEVRYNVARPTGQWLARL
jgi:hypothetical protein